MSDTPIDSEFNACMFREYCRSIRAAYGRVKGERDELKNRCEGYQASRDWSIETLAKALGIEADKVRAVEYYARLAAEKIAAERQKVAELERRLEPKEDA